MCGIAGVVFRDTDQEPATELLRASVARLQHRGPDAQAVWSAPGVGLAHARLALVDLDARSNQPFWDASGRYALVYNGEIYNFRALREDLEKRGIEFRSSGDTEVLLASLLADPVEQVLNRLEGMFAFGLWDARDKTLLLARDRFGMKPLYVYEDEQRLLFASELKALVPWLELETDRLSISSYLLGFGGPTKGHTFFKGVRSVPPGGVVELQMGHQASWSSFTSMTDFLDTEAMAESSGSSPRQIVDRMEQLLYESVEKHMFADARVGAFCSGGVDSSLLMAMAARMHDDLEVFHANVKGHWSERHAASALAEHLGLELRSVDVEEQDFIDYLPKVMAHYEHPFTYHPNCAPLMMVSELARQQGIKGLLSGEGSDECFLGYPWLGRKRLVDAYYNLGARLRSLVRKIPSVGAILWPSGTSQVTTVRDLLNRCEIADDERATRAAIDGLEGIRAEPHTRWTLDYLGYHLRTLLHRNDTMGMSASIEARFPFLDHEVVKAAVNLPASSKLRFSPRVWEKAHPFVRDKWVVRKVADRYMPRDLSRRIKIGFWTTVFERMRVAPQYFADSYVLDFFEMDLSQLEAILERCDQDLTMRLLHLDVWGRTCHRQEPPESGVERLRRHVTIAPE